jgi:hypothetical protein
VDPADLHAERVGGASPDHELALGGRPDRDAAVGLDPRHRHVRLQERLVHGRHDVAALGAVRALGEQPLGVAAVDVDLAGDVRRRLAHLLVAPGRGTVRLGVLHRAGGLLQHLRGPRPHRLQRIQDDGQLLVLDHDPLGGVGRGLLGLRDHGRDRLPRVVHAAERQLTGGAAARRFGQILPGDHGEHAGHGQGGADVVAGDARGRDIAEDELGVRQTLELKVGRESGSAGDFLRAFEPALRAS